MSWQAKPEAEPPSPALTAQSQTLSASLPPSDSPSENTLPLLPSLPQVAVAAAAANQAPVSSSTQALSNFVVAPYGHAKVATVFRQHGYHLVDQIGKDGTVYKCHKVLTGEEFAIKVLDLQVLSLRSGFDDARLMRETSMMQKLYHPNLCRLLEAFKTPEYFLLVLELCRGQDLFDTILARDGISDFDARYLFRQIFSAVGYMHAKGIVHRDLKPENILLDRVPPENRSRGIINENTQIKIVDFGLSKELALDNSFVGTPRYIAPEVLVVGESEKCRRLGIVDNAPTTYGTQVDCYSMGIVLFVSLAGCFPRFHRDFEGYEIVLFASDSRVTPKARALIHGLTHPDPTRRFSMQQALVDPWLLDAGTTPVNYNVPTIGAALLMQPLPRFEWRVKDFASSNSETPSISGTTKTVSDLVKRFDVPGLNQLKEHIEACFAPGCDSSSALLSHVNKVRVLMSESMKVLMVFNNTTDSIVGLVSDTQFACAEGEPDIINSTLVKAKAWTENIMVEAQTLKRKSDQVVHDIESTLSDTKSRVLLSRLQAHRQFVINLDITAQFMVQRTEHLEGLTSMIRNAKMRSRFGERLREYLDDWRVFEQFLPGLLFVHLKMNESLAAQQSPDKAGGPKPDEGMPIGVHRNGMIRLM